LVFQHCVAAAGSLPTWPVGSPLKALDLHGNLLSGPLPDGLWGTQPWQVVQQVQASIRQTACLDALFQVIV